MSVTWPDVVANPRSWCPARYAALVDALVGRRAHQLVGLLVEHGVDGLLDGFPDQLAKLGLHRLLVE